MIAKSLAVGRRCLVVVVAIAGCSMFAANTDVAHAGIGASGVPSFPTSVTVGQKNLPASIEIANLNSAADTLATNTVCNFGDGGTCPANDPGITLTPACGVIGAFSACAAVGADPHVLKISSTGLGAAGSACASMAFTIQEIDPSTGQVRFTPTAPGVHVTLPGNPSVCRIDFTFDVLRTPTIDHDPATPGIQTVQIADDTQWFATTPGSGRGTTPNNMTVMPATPSIATVASAGVGISGQVTDTATISGRVNPIAGATVTFNAYGPNDATCSTAPAFTSTVPVSEPGGTAVSAAYTPVLAGQYRWTATYNGDANNAAASDPCNAANESVTISPVTPTIVTTASGTVPINVPITDTAVVSGRVNPVAGATITFNLYGPDDANCTRAIAFASTKPIDASGSATSNPFAATAAGVYRWIASYSGDANNIAVAEPCNSVNETVTVTSKPTTPTIATTASGSVVVGGALTDQATVSGRQNAVGGATVTFRLYGPNDAVCSGIPVFTSTIPLDASGSAASGPFTPTTSGAYRWIATYNGDINNSSVSGVCGESSETATVTPAAPTIITVATVNTALGGIVTDTAQVSGRVNPVPGATVSFSLYGPDDTNCSRPPIFSSTVALGVDGTATSGSFSPTVVGTYRWIAGYSGDVNNAAVTASCNAPNEAVALLGPDLQQSLPATGARTTVPVLIGTLLLICGGLLLVGVRRRSTALRT